MDIVQRGFYDLAVRIGRGVFHLAGEALETFAFIGRVLVAAGRGIAMPHKVRWAPIITLCERAGLDALPIVAVTTFFIGAVIALLGINVLSEFGASIFVVEMIGIAVLREFGVVITAVLLAGRSASAFAAEIGAMKMRQEIDAMRVMGVDPFEAGVRLVWYVDPATKTVTAYTAPADAVVLTEADTLTGGDVLPGFEASLRDLFATPTRPGA